MKKRHILTLSALSALISLISCDVDDKFDSPDTTRQGSVPAFYSAMLNNVGLRTEYYQVRTVYADHIGVYSQTLQSSKTNSSTAYKENDGYLGTIWEQYYVSKTNDGGGGTLAMYTYMQKTHATDNADVQKTNVYFLNAGKVIVAERTAQLIDLFGHIPYHTAESLHEIATNIPAKFEDPKEIYKELIGDLKDVAEFFKTAGSNSYFSKNDMLLGGNTQMWIRYANSIRLRMLMRIVEAEPAYAEPLIKEIINNPSTYPLVDGGNNANYNPASEDVLLHPLTSYDKSLENAFAEGYTKMAPDYMLNTVMKPVDDVRIPVFFDKNGNSDYTAVSISAPSEGLDALVNKAACWDSTTFWFNRELPGTRITASEVNFLKAEAFERWGASADAKTAYETAVKQSVTYYYYLNSINKSGVKAVRPTETEISDFVANRVPYTTDKAKNLELIATQKWLHFSFMQCVEAWSEYRRTKMPKLATFPTGGKDVGYEAPPTRLMYPSKETTVNPNYEEVRHLNTRTTKIFWDVN